MTPPIPFDESAELLAKLIDGELSEDEHRRLSEMLRADESLRRRAVRLMTGDVLLGELNPATNGEAETEAPREPVVVHRFNPAPLLAIAAAVLISAAIAGVYVLVSEPAVEPKPTGPPIATLVDATGTVMVGNDIANTGRDYPAGAVSVKSGTAEFLLTTGVSVNLRGDAEVTIQSPMSASITRGTGTFRCPPNATGYTVHLPDGSRVVDLSTAFTVHVKPDGTQTVSVDEGEVELRYDEHLTSLDPERGARYADGAWTIVDLADFGIADRSENVTRLAFAPDSVVAGALEDSERLFVIRERIGVRLNSPMAVAIRQPGEYTFDRLSSGPIPAGTVVDSYLLHFDAVGDDRDSVATIEATVRFDRPVLGMIVKAGINENDAAFAAPGTKYEEDPTRGIETEDFVTLSNDRRTVTVRLAGWRPDQIRVFVQSKTGEEADSEPETEGDTP